MVRNGYGRQSVMEQNQIIGCMRLEQQLKASLKEIGDLKAVLKAPASTGRHRPAG
jgi:hypothetical protein